MIIPFNLPGIRFFSDNELIELSLANPDLIIERDNNGQLFIKMLSVSVLASTNKSELIGEVGYGTEKPIRIKYWDQVAAIFLQIPLCAFLTLPG